ncbi:MAG: transglycosylase domain-containing protein [Alphaproteobacteria bacterium]|nr:transglycosylase domain-containing protein [Alphaproteobacteria bacterium]
MSSRRLVGAAVALGATLVVLAGGARLAAVKLADDALTGLGARWDSASHGLLHSEWRGLQRGPVRVERARLTLLPSPALLADGVDVDLSAGGWSPGGGGSAAGGGGAPGWAAGAPVRVEGLTVRWGEEVLAEGLSGSLAPTLSLHGEGVSVGREAGAWTARVERPLAVGPATATTTLDLRTEAGAVQFTLSAPDLVLEHPLLARGALPPSALQLAGRFDPTTHGVDATGTVGDVALRIEGRLDPSDRSGAVELDLSGELPAVLALFGDQVPEARRATCSGELGLHLAVALPDRSWTGTPRATDLTCEGVLTDVDGLKSGEVTWRTTDEEGNPVLRRTGPGERGWTSWQEGRRLADAIMASEDIGFPEHPGYDLRAIEAAMAEAAAGDTRPRGGSTLTQQLAKNLYLSGERTLARKLRELVYALALERQLGKRHILQLYINIVELGPDLYGVGAASEAYFAKRPGGLTDREAAFLATLLPSPSRGHARALQGRANQARVDDILANMGRAGMRTPEELAAARRQPLTLLLTGD